MNASLNGGKLTLTEKQQIKTKIAFSKIDVLRKGPKKSLKVYEFCIKRVIYVKIQSKPNP